MTAKMTLPISLSKAVLAELTATVDALGYNDGNKFVLDIKNCSEVIKDLIRFLRRDDETHSVRRFLGDSKLLQNGLLKIFVDHADKTELWNLLLRLMINLTSPALMVYDEELPTEKIKRNYYLQILAHLQEYKNAMSNEAIWVVVCEKLKNILSIDNDERGEENELILGRILMFIRNVLRVPASDYEKRTDNDTTIHDQVLFALHISGIADLLVYIASTKKEEEYHLQILEIVAFMLQNQNPARLAKVEMQRNRLEQEADKFKLEMLVEKELNEKKAKMRKFSGARHSRFTGSYVVQNMKAIGENEMVIHKPLQKIEDINFSITKQKTKKRKNKLGLHNSSSNDRVPALSVRLFLKEFCVEFLNGAYNPVMKYVRYYIKNDAAGQVDSSHYLWALQFFMTFNRYYNFRVKFVSETISKEVFHFIQSQIDHNYEMIKTDKGKEAYWSIRLHLAMKAYQELYNTLIEMDKSSDDGVKSSCKIIMENIFFTQEYRDTIVYQMLNYNELTMSREYLVDLVKTTHIFLKILKNYFDKKGSFLVQKKKRKKAKKKTKLSKKVTERPVSTVSLEDRWDDLGLEVSAVMKQGEIPDVTPFDATSETPIDEQKGDAMKKIQKLLRCKEYEQAIGLLRSAR